MWHESNSPLVIYLSVEPANIISEEKYWTNKLKESKHELFFFDSHSDEISRSLVVELLNKKKANLLLVGIPEDSCRVLYHLIPILLQKKTTVYSTLPKEHMGKWNKILNIQEFELK